ncbi:MAG: FHA domain-containing protein [Chloroflexia bacterium]|nr:FHA domain-containing protein [Chloroflexia bacterium]
MSLSMRIYYNAVFGALGGLLAWLVSGFLLRSTSTSFGLLLLKDALLGIVVGACIGGALGAVQGFQDRSWKQALRGAGYGALVGLVGGMLGLVVGEIVFTLAGGGVVPRALGWALLGSAVGVSEGLAHRQRERALYGALGGALGGLVGGSTYERVSQILLRLSGSRDFSLAAGTLLGLVILGACIGSLIALVYMVIRRAWFKVIRGRLEGKDVLLTERQNVLGERELPGDSQVSTRQALVERDEQGQYSLVNLDPRSDVTCLNGEPLELQERRPLETEDRVQLGKTLLIFRMEGD